MEAKIGDIFIHKGHDVAFFENKRFAKRACYLDFSKKVPYSVNVYEYSISSTYDLDVRKIAKRAIKMYGKDFNIIFFNDHEVEEKLKLIDND